MPEPESVTYARLVDWAAGSLPAETKKAVAEQVAEAELLAFAGFADDALLEAPPPGMRQTLVERFVDHARTRRRPVFIKRLAATLTFDSGLQPSTGLRGAGTRAASRHLVYATESASITLNVRSRPGKRIDLVGQVFPNDDSEPGSFQARLLDDDVEIGATAAGEVGDFSFRSVSPGAYTVLLSGEHAEILIAPVELKV